MFHTSHATKKVDKVYALLGINANGFKIGKLSAYEASCEQTFHKLYPDLASDRMHIEIQGAS